MSAAAVAAPREAALSLIIPVRDRHDDLRSAVESVAAQSLLPAAVIVVDDGSDPPIAFEQSLVDRLNLEIVRHPTSRGAAAARNSGMRACRTDWMTFLDSDDTLAAGSLAARWGHILADRRQERAPAKRIYGCGWIDVDDAGAELGRKIPNPADKLEAFASGCWFCPGSCIIVNREAVLAVGLQDETLSRLEDLDWFMRLAADGFSLSSQPIVGVRIRRVRRQRIEDMRRVAARLKAKWADKLDARERRAFFAYLDVEIAAASFHSGRIGKAAAHLARSFFYRPRLALHLSPGWTIPETDG